MRETPAVASAALPTHEADAISESKTMHPSDPTNGQAALQPGDPAMEAPLGTPMGTPMEAADEAGNAAASPGAVGGIVAEQESRTDRLYPIQKPLSVPIAPPLLLTDASGNIPDPEGVATESEDSGKTPGGTSPSAQQAAGKPAHAPEPPNLVASGLIMIETAPGKRMSTDEHVAEESVPEGRRKRKPAPPRIVAPDDPLVQIVTQK
jgi:hypothetical protein